MAEELGYVLITPYSLSKSRTGGIIGRLLSLAHLEFVAARMYRFSDEFVNKFTAACGAFDAPPVLRDAWLNYVNTNLRPDNAATGANRGILLVFKGEDACRHLREDVVGPVQLEPRGDTIGGTYGDLVLDKAGKVVFYEPACITAPNAAANRAHLKLFAEYARKDGGVMENVVRSKFPAGSPLQTTLVMLKPENFSKRSRRPGNIIDIFSRTGLYLSAMNLFSMTPAQADDFYGPLRDMFRERLRGKVASVIRDSIGPKFSFKISDETYDQFAGVLAGPNADFEFNRIAEYMTGVDPATVRDGAARNLPGKTRCLALLYTGVDAVNKIRKFLGSTDPTKADPGTVRSDFGRDLMQNGAHASDSAESAERERKIIGLWDNEQPSPVERWVHDFVQ